MIKLIATDIDGTLVADGTLDLNPEYYDVIKELKRRGTIVLAASGRQRASIEKVFTPVLGDISFISENGTCIHSKDYQYVDVIDPEIVRTYNTPCYGRSFARGACIVDTYGRTPTKYSI